MTSPQEMELMASLALLHADVLIAETGLQHLEQQITEVPGR